MYWPVVNGITRSVNSVATNIKIHEWFDTRVLSSAGSRNEDTRCPLSGGELIYLCISQSWLGWYIVIDWCQFTWLSLTSASLDQSIIGQFPRSTRLCTSNHDVHSLTLVGNHHTPSVRIHRHDRPSTGRSTNQTGHIYSLINIIIIPFDDRVYPFWLFSFYYWML